MKKFLIIFLSIIFIVFMAILMVIYISKGDSSRWQVALGGIIVSALPLGLLFLKENPFNIPTIFGYYLFLFCTTYLGSIASFYLHYKWWDSTLHLYKGILVGYIGITLFKVFARKTIRGEISRMIIFLFVVSLAVLASILWEIYEFLGDQFVTHTMQRGGNTDTMLDLLAGLVGGLIIAMYGAVRKQRI
ncbi:membrane-spanning protein [Bacillus sp. FJAT-49736]|uniref:membrane-spanning protein n=1 Tax=Bacillus sp. FJAT-49736 TaxID=2833582 RepID=UPI001BC99B58|nr:membrane-spanning protein [Bacillus sp. FJAT-49736]